MRLALGLLLLATGLASIGPSQIAEANHGVLIAGVHSQVEATGDVEDTQQGSGAGELAGLEAMPPASTAETLVLDLVNAARAQHGLGELVFDVDALHIARNRAAAQVPLDRLSHFDSHGQVALANLLVDANLEYRLAGENLARLPGPESTAPFRAQEALMGSPSHRANILEPTFDRLAVGSVVDDSGRVVFAQIFRAGPVLPTPPVHSRALEMDAEVAR